MAEQKKSTLWERLRLRYRLVILNDASFEEKFSLRLTPGGLWILIGSVTIGMTFLVITLVAFTPVREYIPGYGNVSDQKELIRLSLKVDSLEALTENRELYLSNIRRVLSGENVTDSLPANKEKSGIVTGAIIPISRADSALRQEIESQDKFSLTLGQGLNSGISSYFFFSPVHGKVTESFSAPRGHLGVDITANENEFVKATLDGTVIFAAWTSTDGYVLQLQHSNNLLSIYKHNSQITKKAGEHVKAGESIAIVGNTGENSHGTHLHFELWYNGNPINPQDYVIF